jgi:hypothetical protein
MIKTWPEEEISERLDEIEKEVLFGLRWTLPARSNHLVAQTDAHLVVMSATVLLELVAPVRKLQAK